MALVLISGFTLATAFVSEGEAANSPGAVRLAPCELEHPQHLSAVAAECGELTVAENSATKGGRRIRLAFARIPAISRRKHPDPLFVLAGGPGMAATTFYTLVAPVFGRIHRDRDIVLLDQRGTGKSNPLNCDASVETELRVANEGDIADATRRCLRDLSAAADVTQYTTSIAVKDLDHLREVLGYEQVNLYGASYGTRVAQHYLRRFPQHTRSLVLDGVVPPELFLGADMAANAQRSLQRILARCAREILCHDRLGDPERDYHSLWTMLRSRPVAVSVVDSSSGQTRHFEFTTVHLAAVLRLSIYSEGPTALLPFLLHDAWESKDLSRLAAQFLLLSRSYTDVIAVGMNNTVTCTEDIAHYESDSVDRSKLQSTFLGTAQLDALLTVCKLWPRGPMDPDFHSPLRSAAPVLLLSGSDDPVTPPAYAEAAAHGLTNSLHVVLQDFSHGQLAAACVERVMQDFIDRASVTGLDIACIRNDKPFPFFISINGPSP